MNTQTVFAIAVATFALLTPQLAGQTPAACNSAGSVQFICGQEAPEDLVVVPGSQWVFVSVMSGAGGIRVINVRDMTTSVVYPAAASREQFDARTYDGCPGAPDAAEKASFRTHGLALRPGRNSTHTLYAVHHGKRESIEVFQVDARATPPSLTWIGCAVVADPIGLNSVVALPDGGVVAADFLPRRDEAPGCGKISARETRRAPWGRHTGHGCA